MRRWREHLDRWWAALVRPAEAGRLVLARDDRPGFTTFLALGIALLYALYGVSMGLYRGTLPAVVSGLKLPFLYLLTLAVCYPPLYALNCVAGPRLSAGACLRLLLLAISANAVALASYAPFSFFFVLTTSQHGYTFLVLMHVAVFALASLVSLVVIALIFRATATAAGRPMRFDFVLAWGLLYAFVGTQMSWVLRPWIGTLTTRYQILRPLGGSFIEAVWRLIT